MTSKPGRIRSIAAGLCIALAAVSLSAAMPGAWIRKSLVDEQRFEEIVAAIPRDPAVRALIAREVTDQVFDALDVENRLHEAISERVAALGFLSGSITDGMKDFVRKQVDAVIASDGFNKIWTAVITRLHQGVLKVLRGDSQTVSIQNGEVVLDLTPLIDAALQRVEGLASDLAGHPIDIPALTDLDPNQVIPQLESLLDVDLPDDFGHIVVYRSDELGALQTAFEKAQRLMWLIAIGLVVGIAGALAITPRRRKTLQVMALVFLAVTVLERRLAIAGVGKLIAGAKPENAAAVSSVANKVLDAFLDATVTILWVLILVFLLTLVFGPAGWAVALRSALARLFQGTLHLARPIRSVQAFCAEHRDALRIGIGVVGLALLLFVDLSFGWIVLLVPAFVLLIVGASLVPPPPRAEL
jgi:hypothetical protein